MSVNIEIVSLRANNKPGSVKAFLSVRFGGVTVHDCKLIETDRETWLATPDRPRTGGDGGGPRRESNVGRGIGKREGRRDCPPPL